MRSTRPLQRIAAAIIAVGLFVVSNVPVAAGANHASVSIASWNVKRCLSRSRIERIARGVAALDSEVLILTEFQVGGEFCEQVFRQRPARGWNTRKAMARLLSSLRRLGLRYQYRMPAQSGDGLNIAVLWRDRTSVREVRLVRGTDAGVKGNRKALRATMAIGGFDFHLYGLHLKSGRARNSRRLRSRQVTALARDIRARLRARGAQHEKDVVIMGDFNMIPSKDTDNFDHMQSGFGLRFPSDALESTGSHIYKGRLGNLLDGFALTAGAEREYVHGSIELVRLDRIMAHDLREFGKRVSDHLPIRVRFRIDLDDDD